MSCSSQVHSAQLNGLKPELHFQLEKYFQRNRFSEAEPKCLNRWQSQQRQNQYLIFIESYFFCQNSIKVWTQRCSLSLHFIQRFWVQTPASAKSVLWLKINCPSEGIEATLMLTFLSHFLIKQLALCYLDPSFCYTFFLLNVEQLVSCYLDSFPFFCSVTKIFWYFLHLLPKPHT